MTAGSTGSVAAVGSRLGRRPGAAGLTALLAVLAGIALSNTTVALQHHWLPTASAADTAFAAGAAALGLWLVWFGLQQGEMRASVAGYIGGSLIWIGVFEWTWAAFGTWLNIPPLQDNGMVIFGPGLLLVQATSLIFVALLCVYGTNKDTRCRMFMWFHRTLRLQPGKLTPGYRRQFAKITATETIFLIWFVYVVSLTINDPRLIGYASPAAPVIYVLLAIWSVYLMARLFKLRQQPRRRAATPDVRTRSSSARRSTGALATEWPKTMNAATRAAAVAAARQLVEAPARARGRAQERGPSQTGAKIFLDLCVMLLLAEREQRRPTRGKF